MLVSPNGGETWIIGAAVAVSWSPGSFAGSIDIDLSKDDGATWSSLLAGTANDGAQTVAVPGTPTHQARVRVGAADGAPSTVLAPSDTSDASFQIGGPPRDIIAGLPGVDHCSLAWGDYDSDGDLDLALAGAQAINGGSLISRIYRNDAGTFTDIVAGLPGVEDCSLVWGDYDNDGDLDLALAGRPEYPAAAGLCNIYRNDAGTFTDIGAGLPGVVNCSLAWGDFDNDGDLDLALAGSEPQIGAISRIYRNDAGTFTNHLLGANYGLVPLEGVYSGSLAWGDYDADGDLDLGIAGVWGLTYLSSIYRNDAGSFTRITAGLRGVGWCSLAWGDYDNDGDLDLALAGRDESQVNISRIYRNDNGFFTDLAAGLIGVSSCSLAWGDYDNDGDLDLALAGYDPSSNSTRSSRIYRNDAGTFADLNADLEGVMLPALAWGDYDKDGDPDLALAGMDLHGAGITRIYRNDGGFAPNTPPSAPPVPTATPSPTGVTLTWSPASDGKTPEAGLSYNLRIGTTATTSENNPAMAAGDGFRRVFVSGPLTHTVGGTLSHSVTLAAGTYFASVQAIDGAMAGGPWSQAVQFTVP